MITTANMTEINTAYLGLGSNLGDRKQNLEISITEIEEFAIVTKKSKIHETKPVGYKDQNDFLNMAIAITTKLTPLELIFRLQEIEHKMGRVREIENGPRIIDIDILLYEGKIINQPNLKIPHPRMHERDFVLTPLNEIAPNAIHPKLKQTINKLHESPKNRTIS